MGWQDRSYYRDSSQGANNPLMWLLVGSVPLFTAFGIRVRAHAMLLVVMVLILLFGWGGSRMSLVDRAITSAALFGIVLLHEFGHCFACRYVRGTADEIIMHPLGGVALAQPPRRPWPTFVTVAGGPLVNVVICLVTGLILWAFFHRFPLNPLNPGFPNLTTDNAQAFWTWGRWVWWIHATSWMLLCFNLLPIYPLDGGQIAQTLFWPKFGFYRSMMFSCVVGMVASGIVAIFSLLSLALGMLVLAGLGFYACYTMRQHLLAEGPWGFQEEDGIDYTSSLYNSSSTTETTHKHKKLNKRMIRKAQKRETEELAEQERVDHILAKVSAHGMHSLTWWEKRSLRKATDRQRRRDLDLKEEMTRKGF
jgi:Zn-dependent protease